MRTKLLFFVLFFLIGIRIVNSRNIDNIILCTPGITSTMPFTSIKLLPNQTDNISAPWRLLPSLEKMIFPARDSYALNVINPTFDFQNFEIMPTIGKTVLTSYTIKVEVKNTAGQLQNAMVYLYEGTCTTPLPPAHASCHAPTGTCQLVFTSEYSCFCIFTQTTNPYLTNWLPNYCPSPGNNELTIIVTDPD